MFEDGLAVYFHPQTRGYYTLGTTLRGNLLPKYFRRVLDMHSGIFLMEPQGDRIPEMLDDGIVDEPLPPENSPPRPNAKEESENGSQVPRFRFQMDLPIDERAIQLRTETHHTLTSK